jgi:arylsulfatase A-like enzyme
MVSVVTSEWQYIEHEFNGAELYNLNDDPEQLTNIATENPTALDQLKNYYLDLLTDLNMTWPYDNQ